VRRRFRNADTETLSIEVRQLEAELATVRGRPTVEAAEANVRDWLTAARRIQRAPALFARIALGGGGSASFTDQAIAAVATELVLAVGEDLLVERCLVAAREHGALPAADREETIGRLEREIVERRDELGRRELEARRDELAAEQAALDAKLERVA
jgi:hypothetical protein